MMLNGGFRRALNSQVDLRTFRATLDAAKSPEEAWAVLEEASKTFGFLDVMWRSGERVYGRKIRGKGEEAWTLRIPLDARDYVNFSHGPGSELLAVNVSLLADAVREGLNRPELYTGLANRSVRVAAQ
jgi:hypothetical protein